MLNTCGLFSDWLVSCMNMSENCSISFYLRILSCCHSHEFCDMQTSSHTCLCVITVMCLQCYKTWQTLSTYLKLPTHFIIHCDLSCIVWFSVQCLHSVLSVNVQRVKYNIGLLHHVQEVICELALK